MFREIRRKNKEISTEAAKNLLMSSRRAVLAVNGDEGYPYAVPVNYLYSEEDGKIYFHGAHAGHKADSIKKDDKVCFTVYGNEAVKDADAAWAPFMQSTVVFGRCRVIADRERAEMVCRKFAAKYYPDQKQLDEEMEASFKAVQMYEIEIEHMSGKEIQER